MRILLVCPDIDAANSASNLFLAMKKYTNCDVRLVVNTLTMYDPVDIYKNNFNHDEFMSILESADIIHFNVFDHKYNYGKLFGYKISWEDYKKKAFIFHSHGGFGGHWTNFVKSPLWWLRYKELGYKKVLCCSAMEELIYKNSRYIRNVLHLGNYTMKDRDWSILKLIQTPSSPPYKTTDQFIYECKKYQEQGLNFVFDIVKEVDHKECVRRRGDYHYSYENSWCGYHGYAGLESMAQGLGVFVYQENRVADRLKEESGSDVNPFIRLPNRLIDRQKRYPLGSIGLEKFLKMLVGDMDFAKQYAEGCRSWMNRYWKPRDIVKNYIEIYESIV